MEREGPGIRPIERSRKGREKRRGGAQQEKQLQLHFPLSLFLRTGGDKNIWVVAKKSLEWEAE